MFVLVLPEKNKKSARRVPARWLLVFEEFRVGVIRVHDHGVYRRNAAGMHAQTPNFLKTLNEFESIVDDLVWVMLGLY